MIPLGRHEDQRLEFKGRDVLSKPQAIARAVVAMMNADGGEIWIGLREVDGKAVDVEHVANARRERDRLWNHLIDTLEPSPLGEEIEVEPVADANGDEVLRIVIRPRRERGPYAQLKDGGRFFFVRVGDRVRSMTREELVLAQPLAAAPSDESLSEVRRVLGARRAKLAESRSSCVWIRLEPAFEVTLDLSSPGLRDLLIDPKGSDNREGGWTVMNRFATPALKQGQLEAGTEHSGFTSLGRNGALEHHAPLTRLWHGNPNDPRDLIHPYALIELVVSLVRLASAIHARLAQFSEGVAPTRDRRGRDGSARVVLADLGLFGAKGWKLRPWSPRAAGYMFKHKEAVLEEEDLVLDQPITLDLHALVSEPDRCAFRLIQRVYEGFGLCEDEIPSEFDRRTGRFSISD
jgi:hypothetical protein